MSPGRPGSLRLFVDVQAPAVIAAKTDVVILVTDGLYWLDPTVALIIAVVVAFHALRLLRDVFTHLRDTTPPAPRALPHVRRMTG